MTIDFIIPGKKKNTFVEQGMNEYLKRLSKYAKVNLIYIQERKVDSDNKKMLDNALSDEADEIIKLSSNSYLFLLDTHASQLSTSDFKESFQQVCKTHGKISFAVGSSYGLSDKLRKRADQIFSLSKMTFTHYLAMMLLIEQVYRCFNRSYDK